MRPLACAARSVVANYSPAGTGIGVEPPAGTVAACNGAKARDDVDDALRDEASALSGQRPAGRAGIRHVVLGHKLLWFAFFPCLLPLDPHFVGRAVVLGVLELLPAPANEGAEAQAQQESDENGPEPSPVLAHGEVIN